MLTAEFAAIAQRHENAKALSAYVSIPAGAVDPAAYARIALRNGVAAAHETMTTASHVERTGFEACALRLMNALAKTRARLGDCTWMGFSVADGATYDLTVGALLPVPAPSLVAWDTGFRIAPYYALDAFAPATLALVDHERAAFFRLDDDDLQEFARFETKAKREAGPHMSAPPRTSFHVGTHGTPASDAAERHAVSASERHCARIVDELGSLNGHGRMFIGGASDIATRVAAALPDGARARTVIVPEIHFSSTVPEIRGAVRAVDQKARDAAALATVEGTLASAHGSRLGVLGEGPVAAALVQRAVSRLVIAAPLLGSAPERVEQMVREAHAQNAEIRIVRGAAAAQMEASAAGVGAKLRFPIAQLQA